MCRNCFWANLWLYRSGWWDTRGVRVQELSIRWGAISDHAQAWGSLVFPLVGRQIFYAHFSTRCNARLESPNVAMFPRSLPVIDGVVVVLSIAHVYWAWLWSNDEYSIKVHSHQRMILLLSRTTLYYIGCFILEMFLDPLWRLPSYPSWWMEDTSRVRLSLHSLRSTSPGRINDRHYIITTQLDRAWKVRAAQISEEHYIGRLPESTVSTHNVGSSS